MIEETNSDIAKTDEIAALDDFIVNNKALYDLERKLGNFNIFRTLKFEYGELRHSNVLSWLFQPSESHGLGELFLRRWLMRILLDCHDSDDVFANPVTIDSIQLTSVKVYREWRNIDILIVLETLRREQWIIAIENKVNATQYSKQLQGYREKIDSYFPDIERKLFVFLTKNQEKPEDVKYISADYQQVYEILSDCISERKDTIGPEPLVLLNHYLEILSEVFMENSEIAELVSCPVYSLHNCC